MKSDQQIFHEVREILIQHTGYPAEKINLESSLRDDLDVWGDDGGEILEAIHSKYKFDWTGMECGLMFGDEGAMGPYYVHTKEEGYIVQPCTVNDLVQTIQKGKWVGPDPRPITEQEYKNSILNSLKSLIKFILFSSLAVILYNLFFNN